jgi:hypothetical protein
MEISKVHLGIPGGRHLVGLNGRLGDSLWLAMRRGSLVILFKSGEFILPFL